MNMTPTLSDIEARCLVPYGYAPGNYMSVCISCTQQYVADKRAYRCKQCATELANKKGDHIVWLVAHIRELEDKNDIETDM